MAALNKRSKSDAERADKGRFKPGHHMGRPKGRRNKLSTSQLLDARELFMPRLHQVVEIIDGILERDVAALDADKELPDPATTRHVMDIVVQYSLGRPPQRHEVEVYDAREEAERIADDLGLSDDEKQAVIAETERIPRAGR